MNAKLQNLASLFRNTRTRTIILVTGAVILLVIIISVLRLVRPHRTSATTSSQLQTVANIESVPGGLDTPPSEEYQRLQEQQNIQQARRAEQLGTSAIPTIVSTSHFPQNQTPNTSCCNACCQNTFENPSCLKVANKSDIPPLQASQLANGTLVYDTQGRVIGGLGADGQVRDTQGNRIGRVGPDGLVRDSQGRVLGSTGAAALGAPVYDGAGHLLGQIGPNGQVRGNGGQVIGVVGADGTVRNLSGAVIGKAGRPIAVGRSVYDPQGRWLGAVGSDAKVRDAQGKILGSVDSTGVAQDLNAAVIGKVGRAITKDAPTYTHAGLLGKVDVDSKVREAGRVIGFAGNDGIVRTADGRVIGKTGVKLAGAPVYDTKGQRMGTVGANGQVREANGRVVGHLGSKGVMKADDGRVMANANPVGTPVYDAKGRRIGTVGVNGQVREADGTTIGRLGAEGVVQTSEGRLIGKTGVNSAGAPVYSTHGQLIGQVEADGGVRGSDGQLLGTVDSAGVLRGSRGQILGGTNLEPINSTQAIPGTPVYDAKGRLVATVGTDNRVRDEKGEVVGVVGADGLVHSAAGRLIGRVGATAPGTPIYDEQGQLVGTVGADGLMRDSQGRAIARLESDGFARDGQGRQLGSRSRPTSGASDTDSLTRLQGQNLTKGGAASESPEMQAILKRQAAQISQQKAEQLKQQMQADIATTASNLMVAWTTSPTQQYVPGTPSETSREAAERQAMAATASHPVAVKAGTIMHAVLLTAVNSDEPGPVLAEFVEGQFKGGRLIGALTQQDQKVMLTFTSLNLPKLPQAVVIDAVAIDENTARTALSSYTDNHVLLRYAALFGSSFLEGYGKAMQNSGKSMITPSGAIIIIPDPLDPTDKVYAALGTVGAKFSSVLADQFNKRPTVYVNSGAALGILFTKDMAALPK